MSEKNLTESEWKKFSKGKDFKDAAFLKALALLEKAEKAKSPDLELEALADIEKQADMLRKAAKSDKDLGSYLDGLGKSLDKQRKLAETEAKKAAKADSGDDEEETPALLTTRMVPLLRQVRKGEEMFAMLGSVGKEVAVLVSRRPLAASRRKLLSEYLDGGTPKFFLGNCIFEENAYTFVLKTQAAGLAKKVKAALLKQTELRLKVRVRGEDPDDIDDDGEPDEEGESATAAGPAAAARPAAAATSAAAAEAAAAAGSAPAGAPAGADPLQAGFEKRMAELLPEVVALIKAQAPDASKLRAVAEFARAKGDAGEFKAALAGLDSLTKLVESARSAVPAAPTAAAAEKETPAAPKTGNEAADFNARLAALLPKVKDAVATAGTHGQDVKLKVAEAGLHAQKRAFDAAHTSLDMVEALLRSGAPPNPTEGGAPADETDAAAETRWDTRFAVVEKRYLELLKRNPVDAGSMRTLFAYVVGEADDGNFDKAAKGLEQLEKRMDVAAATTGNREAGYTGIVAYRTTLLALRAAVDRVDGQIASLLSAIPDQMPDEAELAEDLASELREANEALQDLIDDAMGTAENDDTPITRDLTARLDALIADVASNEVIRHVDDNPFGVAVDIGATLGKALQAVRAALPVPA